MASRSERFSYAILGTGALGGLYGGLLAHAGFDVHFLMRSDFDYVRAHGLKIDSPLGKFRLTEPTVYSDASQMPQVDVVVLSWKTTGNHVLPSVLPVVCHSDTIVLVLQNGLNVEQSAADIVGADRVLGGCCFLCSNKVGPGHIHHLDYGGIIFGEYSQSLSGSVTDRMSKLTEQFRASGIDMNPTENLALARWKKLVWNIPFNGLSVVLGANTKQLMDNPHTSQLAEEIMQEVCASASANGVSVPESHVQKMLSATREMVPYDSSMLLDYRARRPIEVESIFGNPLRAARAADYEPAKVEMLYQQLCYLDAWNRGEWSEGVRAVRGRVGV